ncbi:hypothetical protein FJ930_26545 [Mesorhizobium sp. B2-4-15]|nr:hypothetical protein FJ930_26545 [Mesorhizobium sp. B2-4-15]TPM36304.1 hypothetical protein FJ958_00220 [Mesorhizobium sp. B2-3-5]
MPANLPPCGGDVRQDRGGWEGSPASQFFFNDQSRIISPRSTERLAGQHPPLPCWASPPQGGRSAVLPAFANHQGRCD